MAKKKYVDAALFQHKLIQMAGSFSSVPMNSGYYGGGSDLQAAVSSMLTQLKYEIGRDVGQHMSRMLYQLAQEVQDCAIDGGQCLLCMQKDGEVVPENNYGSFTGCAR